MTTTAITREEIFDRIRTAMVELFELDAEQIQLDTRVVEDLDLDSIDAIELAVRMESLTGRRLDTESFRGMRTIADVVDICHRIATSASGANGANGANGAERTE